MKIILPNELLNVCIPVYRSQVEKGDILTDYQELMKFVVILGTHFSGWFTGYIISACLL